MSDEERSAGGVPSESAYVFEKRMVLARRALAAVLQAHGLSVANFPAALLEREEDEWVAVLDAVDAALKRYGVSVEDLLAQHHEEDTRTG